MSIIWWTLYILGALTICILWTQLMALIGTWLKAYRDSKAPLTLTRKDIQSLVRMEIEAYLSKDCRGKPYPVCSWSGVCTGLLRFRGGV